MFFAADKPSGPSSNQILSHIRRYFKSGKVGHLGTLDPLASGLLLIATNESTKLIHLLEKADKTYEFTFDITRTSPSIDLGTDCINIEYNADVLKRALTPENVQAVCNEFVGEILQRPPKFSAIWMDGKRSYSMIRKSMYHEQNEVIDGQQFIDSKSRLVHIYHIDVMSVAFPFIQLRARVSSGTYIRSLAYDIGSKLGGGALITELRRTGFGPITLNNGVIHTSISSHNPNSSSKVDGITFEMSPIEFHPNELTMVGEINYSSLFPNISKIDITAEELKLLQNGVQIRKTTKLITVEGNICKNTESAHVFCIHEGELVALCKKHTVNGLDVLDVIKNLSPISS